MPDHDKDRRTEPPTRRRLERARKRGQVARSAALSRALVLALAVALGGMLGAGVAERLPQLARTIWSGAAGATREQVSAQGLAAAEVLTALLGWPLLVLALAALLADLIQVGPLLAPQRIAPRLERLSVAAGLKRMFSARSLAFLGLATAAALAVGWLTAGLILSAAPTLARAPGAPLAQQVALGADLLSALGWRAAIVLLAFGGLDYLAARRSHRRELFMTPEQARRELREREGDPAIRGQRQRAHRELAQRDPLQACRQADVMVVGDGRVTALAYCPPEDRAPRIVAAVVGAAAQPLLEATSRAGIRRVDDAGLAAALCRAGEGQFLPEKLYYRVADIYREDHDDK